MSLTGKDSFDDEEDDVHICGLCRSQFKDVEDFIDHKKNSCPVRLARSQQNQLKSDGLAGDSSSNKTIACIPSCQNVIYEQSQPLSNISYVAEGDEIAVYDEALHYITVQQIAQTSTSDPRDMNKQATSLQYSVSQQEFVKGDSNVVHNSLSHEYVIETGAPVEDLSASRTEYQPQNENTVYKIAPQVLVDHQSLPVQTSNPHDVGRKVLQLQSTPLQLLSGNSPEKECLVTGQQTVRELLSVHEEVTSQPSVIPAQQIYVEKELEQPQQQLEYTLSLDPPPPEAELIEQSQKGNPYEVPEYTEHIQYTLSSAVQNDLPPKRDVVSKSQSSDKGDKSGARMEKSSPLKKNSAEKKKAPLDKKFQCTFENCTYKTAYLKDLERHHRIHTGEKPFKCEKCDKSFNRNDKLVLHLRYHMNERAFKCDLCDYSAVEKGSLKKHMKCHLDERPHSCQVCPYKSRSASQLQIHLRTHTGDTPYSCTVCSSVFKVSSDLRRHLRTHTGEKPFVCEFTGCSYRCAVKSNLKSHYRSNHTESVVFKCEFCDFKSCSKKAFFEHKKKHDVNPELTCTTCKYQCSNKSALKNHMKIHNQNEKYVCNYCSYKSVQSGNVQAHMRRRHPMKVGRRQRKSKLEPVNRSIQRKDSSDDSEVPKRGNVKTKCQQNFKCDQCKAAFVREDSLKCHMKQHKDKCSSLSTAYAVLKLQQPVINPPNNNLTSIGNTTCPATDINMSATANGQLVTSQQMSALSFPGQSHAMFQGHMSSVQGQTSQGINDILMAAGMTGLSSTGSSPTIKQPETPLSFQELQSTTSANITSKLVISTSNSTVQNVQQNVVISSPSQDKQVPVMQNISLPYMRLPNGQVLILTGQNPSGQIVTSQSDPVSISDDTVTLNANPVNTQQFFPQTVFSDPQSTIQSATMEGTNLSLEPQISDGQQAGAIPIQIILPSDSQQPFPFVSQLINSVVNRDAFLQGQTSASLQQAEKYSVSDGNVQNFVVHIPAQTGLTKDEAGTVPESQSFVLQIPGPSALN